MNRRLSAWHSLITAPTLAGRSGWSRQRSGPRQGIEHGAKSAALAEDIVALAVLYTDPIVRLEFTRQKQFIGALSRHPMRFTMTLDAPNQPARGMRNPDATEQVKLWILELHLADRDRTLGGFYERLLSLADDQPV